MQPSAKTSEMDLQEIIGELYADPLRYVKFVFPWGERASALEGISGPRDWQAGFLRELGEEIRKRNFDGKTPVAPVQMSTVSGHGIGKSALSAMLTKFLFDTRPRSKGTITANTSGQLKTKTWAEIGKWHRMSLTRHWADYTASRGNMSLASVVTPEDWRVDAHTCREEDSEAFAGQHAAASTSWYLFDEASAVPNSIYEVTQGGLTDGEPMWFLFGNGTRNSGQFFESHNRMRHRWSTRSIDSRKVAETNSDLFAEWVKDFGEDSDFCRVRIRGMFPTAGSLQLIPGDDVSACVAYPEQPTVHTQPIIFGVDVARFGDDQSVIYIRRGRDARSLGIFKYRELDTMQLASEIAAKAEQWRPDAIFIDGGGVGGGVVDRCRQLQVRKVIEINFAERATVSGMYANMRAQMWCQMRDAIKAGIALPDDRELVADLTGVEYGYTLNDNAIKLESKDAMKKRGLASPDLGDALALTYALPIGPRSETTSRGRDATMVTDHDSYTSGE